MPITYRKSEDQYFVNPYNFIPLSAKGCSRKPIEDYLADASLTGWIDCELETRSPLFIPNTSMPAQDKDKLKIYDFASRRDLSKMSFEDIEKSTPEFPYIPGSEIRGAIRTAYEAFTRSCMSVLDQEAKLSKRYPGPRKPGVLEKTEDANGSPVYRLYLDCERIGIPAYRFNDDKRNYTGVDFTDALNKLQKEEHEGKWVQCKVDGWYLKRNIKCFRTAVSAPVPAKACEGNGILHLGAPFQGKHHESMIIINDKHNYVDVSHETWNNFKETLKYYKKKGSYEHIDPDNGEQRTFAVYYMKRPGNGKDYYLSPAQIGRETYFNSIGDLVKRSGGGDFQPCDGKSGYCPACALFGTLGKDRSVSGRVRFSDADLIDKRPAEDLFLPWEPLEELASPKPAAAEFYLKRPRSSASKNIPYWNYDYYVDNWNKKEYHDYKLEIRGRKFYWHGVHRVSRDKLYGKCPTEWRDKDSDGKLTRRVAVRPLKEGVKFKFRVYYDRISEKELQTLLWVLTVGGNDDDVERGHKLGMGKPLGLGSVKIVPKRIIERKFAPVSCEYRLDDRRPLPAAFDISTTLFDDDSTQLEYIKKIMELKPGFKRGAGVEYPCLSNKKENTESFKWFVGNRQVPMKPDIDQELADIMNPEMKKIEEHNTRERR